MSHAPYSTKERSHKEVAQSGTEEDTQAQSSNLQNEHAAPAPNSRMHEHNKQESVAGGASISAHTRLHTTSVIVVVVVDLIHAVHEISMCPDELVFNPLRQSILGQLLP